MTKNQTRGNYVTVCFPQAEDNALGMDNQTLESFLADALGLEYDGTTFAPANIVAPTLELDGPAEPGTVVTVNVGEWEHADSFTYAWHSNAVYIPEATGLTYELQVSDVGRDLGCEVTAHNVYGFTTETSSNVVEA